LNSKPAPASSTDVELLLLHSPEDVVTLIPPAEAGWASTPAGLSNSESVECENRCEAAVEPKEDSILSTLAPAVSEELLKKLPPKA
jgi:hypothetical protein